MTSVVLLLSLCAQADKTVGAGPVHAPVRIDTPAPIQRLGIFQVSMAGVDPALQTAAIDALATAAADTGRFQVVSRSELDQMLGAEKIKEVTGCDEMSCLAEIGAAAGVERVVGGSVSRVEAALVVSLQLVNTAYASTENRITVTWKGDIAELPEVLGAAAELLLVPAKERTPGAVNLTGVPATAVSSVDGKARGSGPMEVKDLAVGVHTLHVEALDHEPFDTGFVVRMGQTRQLGVRLNAVAASPFYERWWFWTGVGVVTAGIAGVALASGGDDSKSNDGPSGNNNSDNPGSGTITITGSVPGY